jgi:hypothetical protein
VGDVVHRVGIVSDTVQVDRAHRHAAFEHQPVERSARREVFPQLAALGDERQHADLGLLDQVLDSRADGADPDQLLDRQLAAEPAPVDVPRDQLGDLRAARGDPLLLLEQFRLPPSLQREQPDLGVGQPESPVLRSVLADQRQLGELVQGRGHLLRSPPEQLRDHLDVKHRLREHDSIDGLRGRTQAKPTQQCIPPAIQWTGCKSQPVVPLHLRHRQLIIYLRSPTE